MLRLSTCYTVPLQASRNNDIAGIVILLPLPISVVRWVRGSRFQVDQQITGVLLVLCSAICFGTAGILAKFAFEAGLGVSSTLALRYSLAGISIWAVVLGRRFTQRDRSETLSETIGDLRLRGRSLLVAIGIGVGGYGLANWLYFWGLQSMTAGTAAIIFYMYPLFVLVLSTSLLGERLTRRLGISLPLGVGGVVLITGTTSADVTLLATLVVTGAAIAYACYLTGSRAVLASLDPVTFTAHVLPSIGIAYWGVGFATGRVQLPVMASSWLVIALLATVATAVPTLALCAGLARIEANRASVLGMAEPLGAVVLGAIVLGESVPATTVIGGVLIVGGAYVARHE